jgi:hypothetical protein
MRIKSGTKQNTLLRENGVSNGASRRLVLTNGLAFGASFFGGRCWSMDTWSTELLSFASDMSGGNADVQAATAALIATPPTTLEAIGFYGAANWPARTRIFLGVVSVLNNAKITEAVEDKYSWELIGQWQSAGLIDVEALPPAGRGVFEPIAKALFEEDVVKQAAYRRFIWENYAQATRELEAQIARGGKRLMSLDATSGDTMFFIRLAPAIAERWQERAFSDHDGYRAGLRQPMWDRFFDHLGASLGNVVLEDGQSGYPPGTRLRDRAIPLIT